jgi:hypothetical protein
MQVSCFTCNESKMVFTGSPRTWNFFVKNNYLLNQKSTMRQVLLGLPRQKNRVTCQRQPTWCSLSLRLMLSFTSTTGLQTNPFTTGIASQLNREWLIYGTFPSIGRGSAKVKMPNCTVFSLTNLRIFLYGANLLVCTRIRSLTALKLPVLLVCALSAWTKRLFSIT